MGGAGTDVPRDGIEIELVDVSFPVHFMHDLLVVVVANGTTQFVVVHAGFAFPATPEDGDSLRV